jgi:hypothetical protein
MTGSCCAESNTCGEPLPAPWKNSPHTQSHLLKYLKTAAARTTITPNHGPALRKGVLPNFNLDLTLKNPLPISGHTSPASGAVYPPSVWRAHLGKLSITMMIQRAIFTDFRRGLYSVIPPFLLQGPTSPLHDQCPEFQSGQFNHLFFL